MSVNRLRNLCVKIYETINKLNPEFVNNIFKVKENKKFVRELYKLNLETPKWNQVTVGAKSLKVSGSKSGTASFSYQNIRKSNSF